MPTMPDPISKKNALSAVVFGAFSAAGLILIVYRMLIE